jgi:formylmethanofuran dehydrogenase subunit E
MAKIIRFIGRSGAGKTTLTEDVVRILCERGLSVAVIKHAHHNVELDVAGKDSFRFTGVGARLALVASPEKLALFEAVSAAPPLENLARYIPTDVDVTLAEGFHDASTPYFLVLAPGETADDRPHTGELLGEIEAPRANSNGKAKAAAEAIVSRIVDWLNAHAEDERLNALLEEAQAFHGHLCPGQMLGVRLAVVGSAAVGLPEPRGSKALVVWVEVDRCGADAIQTVTGCRPGKRTLKFVDHGKLAATFLNTKTGEAVRVVARSDSRERAAQLYPDLDRKDAQSLAYRTLPDHELFDVQPVAIDLDEFDQPGKPLIRVTCVASKEEVNDFRHVSGDDGPLCRACAGQPYYRTLERVERERPW